MNLFLSALFGGFIQIAGTLVGRVLLSLGIGYVAYTGIDLALGAIKDQAFTWLSSASSISPQIERFMGVFQIGTCFNIIFSAYAAKLVLNGMVGGTIKRMVQK